MKFKYRTNQIRCEFEAVTFAKIEYVHEGERGYYYCKGRALDAYRRTFKPVEIWFRKQDRKKELYFFPIECFQIRQPPPKKGDYVVGIVETSEKGKKYKWWYSDSTIPQMFTFYHYLLQRSLPKKNSSKCFEALKRLDDPNKEDEWWAFYLLLRGNIKEFVDNTIRHPARMDQTGYKHSVGFRLGRDINEFVWGVARFDPEIDRDYRKLLSQQGRESIYKHL